MILLELNGCKCAELMLQNQALKLYEFLLKKGL